MAEYRILVTGSRDWHQEDIIEAWLETMADKALKADPHTQIIIVHGDCPTGADRIAKDWALGFEGRGIYEESHPALWKEDGYPQAGPMRNQRMVDLGADVCLAFPLPDSRGTYDCMRRVEAAGIPLTNCAEASGVRTP